ncbi:unnamed protein product [Microthlaspi erraticum]|uniref:NOA1/YqeH-like C-terminal domain-containing protein n=1 Tax=Microthlaspi erraticum TaxID=1685480 RepID=A0A6D2I8X0_9BRAS|nr:unnamed protein product [Microthlaspi erraticum]
MGKKENAHKTLEEHFGERRVEEMGKWVRKEFRVSGSSWDTSSVDIAVSGLGWFAVGLKGDAVLGVWTHEGIDVVVRDSLLPQRALTFEEDSGFTVSKIVAEADRAFNQNSCNADVEATMNFRPLLVSSHLLKITAPARLWRTCTFPAPVAPVSAEKPKRRFSSSPEPLGGAIGRTTISDIAAMVSPAVVHIHVPQDIYGGPDESSASGMCIDNVGTILTCAHVVLNPNGKYIKKDTYPPSGYKVSVTFADGKQFNGMVKKYDFDADLAIVSIGEPSQDFPSVVLGTSRDVRQGDFTVAIGSPLVLPRSVTFGIMSCIDRTKQEMLFWGGLDRLYFQTDCYTNKGSSGCPLVDLDGKVVAIHFRSLINSKNLHEAGCGFGIPIDDAKSFIGDYYM